MREISPGVSSFSFFGFGYKELKVGREYMGDVFNGFINA